MSRLAVSAPCIVGLLALLTLTLGCSPAGPSRDQESATAMRITPKASQEIEEMAPVPTLRVATFNVSLYGKQAGQILDRLSDGEDRQAEKIAAIVQTVRPDILVVNEIDFDAESKTARVLNDLYFARSQDGLEAWSFPHVQSFPSNTGVDSGLDINGDQKLGSPDDAWGYGVYPGQYAMAVFSRHAIRVDEIRSFQNLLWSEMPGALVPVDPKTGKGYYSDEVWSELRLSSKNHVDVPVRVDGRTLHVLASHPTPPVFDGPADHNGCRNHDEIRLWTEYIGGGENDWLRDDGAGTGGLAAEEAFVIFGDLNADPDFGDGRREAIENLLAHPRTIDPEPAPAGATDDAEAGRNQSPLATADFGRNGLMRVDYVLPGDQFRVVDAGVFWPRKVDGDDVARRQRDRMTASDHRLVWVDVAWQP